MNIDKYTKKSIEAIQSAQSIALEHGNQQIEQIHLLYALTAQENGLISSHRALGPDGHSADRD